MMNVAVSQKLIAKQSGVSQSTVSLILSGRKVGSEATRSKVMQTTERLGYRPNLLVHGIQTGKTKMIGVMVAPVDFYWTEVLYGIHDVLSRADHVPINIWTSHHGTAFRQRREQGIEPLQQIHRLLDRRIDGVILWPPLGSVFQEHITEFSSRNLPVVTIDHELPEEFQASSVCGDKAAGGTMAANHFLELGHSSIGQLAGPSQSTWARYWRTSFEQVLAQKGDVRCVTLEANLDNTDPGLGEVRRVLGARDRPTAIFAATHQLAKLVYLAAQELGIEIPREVSVIGFADDDFAASMNPPLTAIRQCAYEIGGTATELVLKMGSPENTHDRLHQVVVPAKLIRRQSTAKSP